MFADVGESGSTPVLHGNRLVIAWDHQGASFVTALDAQGDITGGKAIVWSLERDMPYVPSPLLHDGLLYVLKGNAGILSVFDAKTGRPHYQLQRLAGIPEVYASPVAAQKTGST